MPKIISNLMPKLMAASALTTSTSKSNNQSVYPVLLATSLDDTTLHGFLSSPQNLKVILPLASVGLVLLMIFMTALYFTLWRCFNKMHLKSTEMSNRSLNETNNRSSSYGTYGSGKEPQQASASDKQQRKAQVPKPKSWSSFSVFGTLFRKKSDNLIASDSEADGGSNVDQKELNRILNRKKNSKSGRGDDENIKLKKISLSTSSCSQYNSNSSLSSISKIVSNDNIKKYSARSLEAKPNIIVNFSVYFNNTTRCLFVNVISLENVKVTSSMSQSSELNVYVKMEIKMPDDYMRENKDSDEELKKLLGKMAKTRLIKNTSNPVFDETFEYENFRFLDQMLPTKAGDSDSFQLIFYICNSNLFGRDQLIGQLEHKIHRNDLISSKELVISPGKDQKAYVCRVYSQKVDPIDSRLSEAHSLGQLNMSLIYDDSTQTIKIHIINGTNIKMPRYYTNKDKIPSPFIKIYLLYRGQRLDKKQTKIVEKTSDPLYDETFDFNLASLLQILMPQENMAFDAAPSSSADASRSSSSSKAAHIKEVLSTKVASRLQLLLLVMDWDQVEKSDVIGKIELKTQHHLQRLITSQHMSRNKSLDTEFLKTTTTTATDSAVEESDTDSVDLPAHKSTNFATHHIIKKPTTAATTTHQNWFDIFYRPNTPILGTFQINNY